MTKISSRARFRSVQTKKPQIAASILTKRRSEREQGRNRYGGSNLKAKSFARFTPQWMHWSNPRSRSKLFMEHEGIPQDHNRCQTKQWEVFPAKSSRGHRHDTKSKENTPKRDRGRSGRAKRKWRSSDRCKQYQGGYPILQRRPCPRRASVSPLAMPRPRMSTPIQSSLGSLRCCARRQAQPSPG